MIARPLMGVTVAFAAACATPGSPPRASDEPADVLAQIREAAKVRDVARLKAVQITPQTDARVVAELGQALYWAASGPEAKDALIASCNDARVAKDSKDRSESCAVLAFDELAAGKPLNHVVASGQGAFLDKQKLFIAMVAVNGNPPEPFIVDTGAPMTVISKRYADKIKLTYRTDVATTSHDAAANPVRLQPTLLTSVKWGTIEVETVPAYVLELPENFKVGGILAPQDLLRGTGFELDGPAKILRTTTEQTAAEWIHTNHAPMHETPLLWNGGNFFVEAEAAGLPRLEFLLDSGAGGNGVCAEALAEHHLTLDGGTEGKSGTAAGTSNVRSGLEGSVSVAGSPPQASGLFVSPCPKDADDAVSKSGYVGAPWFWGRRVFFAADRRSIVFTEASATP